MPGAFSAPKTICYIYRATVPNLGTNRKGEAKSPPPFLCPVARSYDRRFTSTAPYNPIPAAAIDMITIIQPVLLPPSPWPEFGSELAPPLPPVGAVASPATVLCGLAVAAGVVAVVAG